MCDGSGGALYSLSGSAAGTIDPDNRSFNSGAADEAVTASVTYTIPERISPVFTPVKRIKGDLRLNDGTYRAVQYEVPIHYKDSEGKWEEYDNRLDLVSD